MNFFCRLLTAAKGGSGSNGIHYHGYIGIDSRSGSWSLMPGGTSDTPVHGSSASEGDALGQIGAPEKSGPM